MIVHDAAQCFDHRNCALIDRPVLLRGQGKAATIGTATLVAVTIGHGRRESRKSKVGYGQAAAEDGLLERGDIAIADGCAVKLRDRILPKQIILDRHFRAEIAFLRTHVAMRQLVPCLGKGLGKGVEIVQELLTNLAIFRIDLERDIAGHHHKVVHLTLDMRVRRLGRVRIDRRPLKRAGRAALLFPFELEQIFQIAVVPLRRIGRPAAFDAVGHRILGIALAARIVPAQAHRLHRGNFRACANLVRRGHAVALAEGVAAGDQCHGLLIVHRHAREGDANVAGGRHGIAIAIRAFGIDVDQRLMGGGEGVFQVIIRVAIFAAPALVARDHAGIILVVRLGRLGIPDFRAPIGGVVGFPRIEATAAEAIGRQTHDLERDIARQRDQIGPGQRAAIFLLDRLQQAAGFVRIAIIPPAADRGEALHRRARAAAPIGNAIGARRVPGHADHLRTIIAIVGRPPGHGRIQEGLDVVLQLGEIDLVECLGIIEVGPHRIGGQTVLVQQLDPQTIWIPVFKRWRRAERAADTVSAKRAFAFHHKGFCIGLVVGFVEGGHLVHRAGPSVLLGRAVQLGSGVFRMLGSRLHRTVRCRRIFWRDEAVEQGCHLGANKLCDHRAKRSNEASGSHSSSQ